VRVGACIDCGAPAEKKRSRCRECFNAWRAAHRASDFRACGLNIVSAAGQRARRLGVDFDREFMHRSLSEAIERGYCPVSKLPFKMDNNALRPSPDRLDGNRGYVEGNVVWVAVYINLARSNFTLEMLRWLWPPAWVLAYETLFREAGIAEPSYRPRGRPRGRKKRGS